LDNFILFICLLNFFLDKEVNIPTYNLFETIHNIWLQQFGKRGTYFFATTSNDYMWTFKQSSLYYAFWQGGAYGTNPDKNELHLCSVGLISLET
jgi:hypothetical protein